MLKASWMNVNAPRGINRSRWAPNGTKELMKFNEKGQLVEPPHTVARFSKFGTLDWTYAITIELEPKIRCVYEMKLNDRWKKYKANLEKVYYTSCLRSLLAERFHCHDGRVNQGQWKLLVQLWDTLDAYKRATSCRKNRKILQINHTSGTKTFAHIKHKHVRLFQVFCVMKQVNESKSDCITFFTLTYTRKNGEPVDARSAAIIDDFNTKLKLYEDRNEIITDEVRHIMYADVLGPERNNCGLCGLITEKNGIYREVEAIRASYEEQIKAANIEIERLRMEASERKERQRFK
ncbi:hypothetical protein DVH24_030133 [Malus domestica]|uniref:Uncharacterized protein n=1 Tax=Malus domestica TaxID=3750 RepID=A0A498HZK1_MALDO|nr:hypothetical protein DVH24_030133 [Malus domestica]